ncbi:MAG: methyltransferase domain-containing protein [Bacteroidia bacterium]|nr:methyltransferase domain-containing protein [Bacteroidia bacterium]
MPNFKIRSTQTELLDETEIPKLDLYQNLLELNTINTWLGGHQVTLKGIKQFELEKHIVYTLIDIGCGGGDNLIYLAKWAKKNGYKFNFIGVDLKKDCIDYAILQANDFPEISFIQADYNDLPNLNIQFDFALACLFTHHLPDLEIIKLIKWCNINAKQGFIINDLHRHFLAYYSIAWLTQIFSNSYLVKNDAKLSVARGFVKNDWQNILEKSNIQLNKINLKWAWAFRWLVIGKKH